jgi:AraC family transcriptional regulator of adaptative response/methylated-DNA-[protein]-cysteine methyltransferase
MQTMSNDYARVERAIRFLTDAAPRQPRLADLAAHVGLSEFHMQRMFTRWAGISPKRFMQVQTLDYARECLQRSPNVLDATFDAGLSSGGRLHDLFVTLEAVTPGEVRSGGLGIRIDAGFHDSPFGTCLLATTERGICGLTFVDTDREAAWAELESRWPNASVAESLRRTSALARRVFAPLGASDRPLALLVHGTNFQVAVWRALLRIPAGSFASYEEVAATIGSPRAVRAVGTAVGHNPIAFLIPCHRVIRASGALGGYRWGTERKRAITAWEAGKIAG